MNWNEMMDEAGVPEERRQELTALFRLNQRMGASQALTITYVALSQVLLDLDRPTRVRIARALASRVRALAQTSRKGSPAARVYLLSILQTFEMLVDTPDTPFNDDDGISQGGE